MGLGAYRREDWCAATGDCVCTDIARVGLHLFVGVVKNRGVSCGYVFERVVDGGVCRPVIG